MQPYMMGRPWATWIGTCHNMRVAMSFRHCNSLRFIGTRYTRSGFTLLNFLLRVRYNNAECCTRM